MGSYFGRNLILLLPHSVNEHHKDCFLTSTVPSTDTPGTPSDPLRLSSASAPADLITSVCTVYLCAFCPQQRVQRGKIAQGEAEESYVFTLVLFSSERKLFVSWNNCRENTLSAFSYGLELIPHLLWKVKKGEKNVHTLYRTHPLQSHASRTGPHTRTCSPTHKGVSNTVYCCLE